MSSINLRRFDCFPLLFSRRVHFHTEQIIETIYFDGIFPEFLSESITEIMSWVRRDDQDVWSHLHITYHVAKKSEKNVEIKIKANTLASWTDKQHDVVVFPTPPLSCKLSMS